MSVLIESKDPMGRAILDFQETGCSAPLYVLSSMFEDDEMPVDHLFRSYNEMPEIETTALSLVRGKVLDIGAGAGSHSLYLAEKGFDVKSIDISPLSCKAMKLRGLNDVECINVFDNNLEDGFDTILVLMNGTGIAGTINRLPAFFKRLSELLKNDGQILIDSSDLKYIYEDEDGSMSINLNDKYYGEVDYKMVYCDTIGDTFDWLYVDFPLLATNAVKAGLKAELVFQGEHYDYLARITKY